MPCLGFNFIAVMGAYVTRPEGAWRNRNSHLIRIGEVPAPLNSISFEGPDALGNRLEEIEQL